MESKLINIFGTDINPKDIKSPYDLYRKLRPYFFSDSRIVREMTPEIFELNMNRLSQDMKQDMFEEMTRQIICKNITPNLIPQTGPTGGGDGKTDIETYLVDDEISDKWHYLEGCKGKDKWAFAISCKTDWKTKINSDIKKIVGTNRGFTKIYFCSNQLISSKNKADYQKKFQTKYNIEVVILDYNWYKQEVFENGCYNIAVTCLNLSSQLIEKTDEGPGDKAKREKLEYIDNKILNATSVNRLDTAYVELLLEAAILCRELEQPKIMVAGRFALALEQAKKHGTLQQVFNVIYQKGWTEFYWNQDTEAMFQQYLLLKEMIVSEVNATRVELLYNLWNLTNSAVYCGLFKQVPDIQTEKSFWTGLYEQLSKDDTHKSSALYLKICLLETQLLNKVQAHESDINSILEQLKEAIDESVVHIDIPFETHVQILSQIGYGITNNPLYEEIVDMLADRCGEMKSEVTAAEIQYDRGIQNLSQKNYVTAIKHLGKSITAFQKESTKGNLIQATGMLAMAYSGIDLLFSAKVLLVKTLALLIHKTQTEGTVDHLIITILFSLCRLELKLGQLNSFFNWLLMLDTIGNGHPSFIDESYITQRQELDSILATIALSSACNDSNWALMPSLSGAMGLYVTQDAALYALGYKEETSKEFKEVFTDEVDLTQV